jgi:colanic acid/amylovoran biosynthesis glycosyltransferase
MRVGHLVSSYLHVTEGWIHAQITAAGTTDGFVLNRGDRVNSECFPIAGQRHLADLTVAECRREADAWEREGRSRAFYETVRARRGNLLHAHFATEGVLAVPLAAALGLPLVTSFYGYDATVLPRDPDWNRALRRLFEVGTLFLAEGPALADTLVRLGCPPSRVRIASLPVPIPPRPASSTRRVPLVLVVGRLVEKKGVDTSLRVLARLREHTTRPFRAVIIGDGPERERLTELHRRLRLADHVTFAGAVDPETLRAHLARAAAVLQMSRTATDGDAEGGAPVILSQALAHGVPVVATRHCDIPWIVEDGRTGVIVESGDVGGAAARLARILEQPHLARAFGRAGRACARRRWSPAACGEALERYYAEAIGIGPVPESVRRERLHPRLVAGIVLDLRARAGDSDGLARLSSAPRLGRDLRWRVHRALGQLYARRGDAAMAACAYRRWRRLTPGDPDAGVEEARAWLRSETPARAIVPLAAFVTAHAVRPYALAVAVTELETHGQGPVLARALLARVGTPGERLAFDIRRLERAAGQHAPARNREGLRRALARFRRTQGTAPRPADAAQSEAALVGAYLLALRIDDASSAARLRWVRTRVRLPLLRYRIASALAPRGGASADWARRAFAQLARSHELPPDSRAGAWFHLAEIDQRTGMTRHARRALGRCLAIVPAHDAAIRLRESLVNGGEAARP